MRYLSLLKDDKIVAQIPTTLSDDEAIALDEMLRSCNLYGEGAEVCVTDPDAVENPPRRAGDISQRIDYLRFEVELRLPVFAKAVREAGENKITLCMCYEAFAEDYQEEDMRLMAMFLKYAELYGVQVLLTTRKRDEPFKRTA